MIVRRTEKRDINAILELYRLQHVRPFMRMPTAAQLEHASTDKDACSIVIDGAGGIAGHALVKNVGADPRIAELSQLLVREPRRGSGSILVQWVLNFVFNECGSHRLYLEVVAGNSIARAIYEARGFTLEGMFRDGFPADDGTFEDLAAYGMLATEYRAARGNCAND